MREVCSRPEKLAKHVSYLTRKLALASLVSTGTTLFQLNMGLWCGRAQLTLFTGDSQGVDMATYPSSTVVALAFAAFARTSKPLTIVLLVLAAKL